MNVLELREKVKSGDLSGLYAFTGPEWMVQKLYINQIAKVKNLTIHYINTIDDVYDDLQNMSFFGSAGVYVVRDDKNLLNNAEIVDNILDGVLGDNIIILLISKIDKRLKFYKQHANLIYDFELLPDELLVKYIQKSMDLYDNNCIKLIDICERDYGRMLSELDKIRNYAEFKGIPNNSAIVELVNNGTIRTYEEGQIFDLVDAVLYRNVSLVYKLLSTTSQFKENPFGLMSLLYSNLKALLQVQSCESSDVCRSTGLNEWQVKRMDKYVGYYEVYELVGALRFMQDLDIEIKSGKIAVDVAIDYLMVNIL